MHFKHFKLTRTLQGVSSWGFHPCLEVWEDQDNPHQGGSRLLLPRASAEQVRILLGMDTKSMLFILFHYFVCVWQVRTSYGVWSVLCVACGSQPRTLAIKHSLNQQMHLKCTDKYGTVASKQIHLKWGANPSVCVGQIQPGQVIRVWWKPGGQRVRVTITMVQCN